MREVSVIVPTYRDWPRLAGCLDCLAAQTVGPDAFEIVVADNAPGGSVPIALPTNARVVAAPAPGSYAARNAAVAVARGRVLFFTDSDCWPEAGWIAEGLAALAARAPIERLGGRIEIVPAGPAWTVPELWDRIFELQQARYVAKGYAATANLIVTRALFDRVGPFDANLFSSGDKAWNGRAATFGPIGYAERAVVRHPARRTFEENATKRARIAAGRLATRRKGRWRSWAGLPKYLLPAPASLVRIAREPGLTPGECLAVAAFDYRLRLFEGRVLAGLLTGQAPTRD
jgi:glycosyltransferase involved in cell wall biosynthesis